MGLNNYALIEFYRYHYLWFVPYLAGGVIALILLIELLLVLPLILAPKEPPNA